MSFDPSYPRNGGRSDGPPGRSRAAASFSYGEKDYYLGGSPLWQLFRVADASGAAIPGVKVFHSGTQVVDGQVVTAGGRVLTVTALGDSIAAAKLQAYTAVKCIRWPGAWCRKDIADKAMQSARDEQKKRP
jgi:phosphoribosylamine--glycine ligase